MSEGRRRHDWDQTAEVLAMVYNANRAKGRPATARDFHPCPTPRDRRGGNGRVEAHMSLKQIRDLTEGRRGG
jgi:hypothetical protein